MPSADEELVFNLLKERFGLDIEYIEKQKSTPTPDYLIKLDSVEVAVAELKTLTHFSSPEEARNRGYTVDKFDENSFQAERNDNTPIRIASAIHKASKQLRKYELGRVVVLYDLVGMDKHDLSACLSEGYYYMAGGIPVREISYDKAYKLIGDARKYADAIIVIDKDLNI